MLYNIIIYQLN